MQDTLKVLFWDVLVQKLMERLFLAAPFLSWGPFGIVARYIVTQITDRLWKLVKFAIDDQKIVFRNEEFRKEYDRAAVKLKLVLNQYGADSVHYEDARKAHRDALASLVRFVV